MKTTALILVDIQNDYFPGGKFEQEGAAAAGQQAAKVLTAFRKKNLPVIHIRHESVQPDATFFLPGTKGAETNPIVSPIEGESVLLKHYPNSFIDTALDELLRSLEVKQVVIVGMMTLMCIDATSRAAKDLGYEVIVLSDACAARDLEFNTTRIPAAHVHGAFLAALKMYYADVLETERFIAQL